MQNTDGKKVDLYIPRKCSATNRLITPKDYAAVQIQVADVDDQGRHTGSSTSFALCGKIRILGDADAAFNCLATDAGFLHNVVKPKRDA